MSDKGLGSDKAILYTYTYKDDGSLDKAALSGYRAGELQDTYDKQGRQTGKRVKFGEEKAYTFGYDKSGASVVPDNRLTSVGLPTGRTVSYEYDSLGRMKKRSISTNGHAITETYAYLKSNYNPNICKEDRTTEYVSTLQYAAYNYSASAYYSYDKRGNISEVVDNGKTYRYEYDGADRLLREDNEAQGFTKKYEYDGNGNIVKVTRYNYTAAENPSGGQVTVYSYDTGTHKDRLVKVTYPDGSVENISGYDFIGNPCNYRGNVVEWKRGRQLAKYGSVTYKYDASGIRQEKQVGSVLHKYYTDGSRIYKEERGSDVLWYHYDNTGITGLEYNGTAYYFQKNIQGDVVRIYDGNGSLAARYEYDAWGNHRIYDEYGVDITEDIVTGGQSFTFGAHIGRVNPFRYRGYYYDAETGLYYLNSRYYDPSIGRFINADDISYIQPTDINGLNLFAYCGDNPVMYTDPNGNFALISFLIGLGIAAGIGAGIGAISYVATEAISYAITGEWNWSWGMFAGSIFGGAIGGALSFAFPILGTVGSAFINGFVSNAIGMGLQNVWEGANHSLEGIIVESIINGGLSALTSGITSKVKISGFTGRGSISQVSRQIYTKFYNGQIRHISARTFGKLVAYEAGYSVLNVFINIFINTVRHYKQYNK